MAKTTQDKSDSTMWCVKRSGFPKSCSENMTPLSMVKVSNTNPTPIS